MESKDNVIEMGQKPKPEFTKVETWYTNRTKDVRIYPELPSENKQAWKTRTTEYFGEAPEPDYKLWTGVAVVITLVAIGVAAYCIASSDSEPAMIPAGEQL